MSAKIANVLSREISVHASEEVVTAHRSQGLKLFEVFRAISYTMSRV